jgi:opacity protein-like surface antigen
MGDSPLYKRLITALCFIAFSVSFLQAQAKHTASRAGDFQIGVDFAGVKSDYFNSLIKGFGLYTTFDFTNHFGAEFEINQAHDNGDDHSFGKNDGVYERTYELGGRYFRTYGPVSPYVKLMYGRGVFNFPNSVANLAYNIFTGGIGLDVKVRPYLNVRANYEYQDWHSFPPNGLSPQMFTVGVAYHFPGQLKRGRHY